MNLIERLENAPEGSLELSDAVLESMGWMLSTNLGPQRMYIPPDNSAPMYQEYAPSPTESLDDALTLVPEGWEWSISNFVHLPYGGYVHLRNPSGPNIEAKGKTPALALCIAALKARAALDEKERP